ncbi:MAG: HAMP domain-containing sensor histidine kinase [Patescibacteria group bacterium]|jgi:signal transduction histidine kinase
MLKKRNNFLLRQSHQVVYAIVLILLIPLAIIINTIWSVKSFQTNIDISLQRQALMIGQLFDSTVYEGVENNNLIQDKVQSIKDSGVEIRSFDILLREGEIFKTIASFDETKIGNSNDDLNYIISWYQNEAVATLVSAPIGTGSEQERLWEIAMPLKNAAGEKEAILSLRLSLKLIDDLVKDTLTKSYFILAITVLIVILLLALNTRLFEHALLFRKLKEVDKMKDEFISVASHELRTPITTLKGFISMAMEGDYGELNEKGKNGFKIMEASTNRLGALVEDLLNVSRIEQHRLEFFPKPIDVGEILKSMEAEFDLRIKAKNLQLKLIIEDDLPKVWADEDKFRQVLVNLIGNAVKYTKQGEIEFMAKKTEAKFVTITIKDTGIGMEAKEREALFAKFYRVQGEDTRGIVGTGLGLWISKQLVELMGGKIYVDSIKHVGSQFYFSLPVYNKLIHVEKPKEEIKK